MSSDNNGCRLFPNILSFLFALLIFLVALRSFLTTHASWEWQSWIRLLLLCVG